MNKENTLSNKGLELIIGGFLNRIAIRFEYNWLNILVSTINKEMYTDMNFTQAELIGTFMSAAGQTAWDYTQPCLTYYANTLLNSISNN